MAKYISVQGKSQYDQDINPAYQPSACGPVTAFVLLQYLLPDRLAPDVNTLYRQLGGTKIGLSARRFVRRLSNLLGSDYHIQVSNVEDALHQIDENRPVALKFDKWFTFKWRGQFSFDYHWVVLVGYDYVEGALYLLVHDNGSRNCESTIRSIPYEPNKDILTFVTIEPLKRKSG
ncbi:hypothetical protein DV702_08310 [Sporosarcina sp. PTS2304]|uniref:C39 family peptidase n=1 Tax=Sporosarcina sp. PTS2304 TaxID=2283194 RepID=UPI000E0CD70A|nr:C39 family peptidase [Sporosarcina sp. PTS2304]AXH99734.1 hypothetical protein DV702_08310 [Sporosarcina sp. PTS2304]